MSFIFLSRFLLLSGFLLSACVYGRQVVPLDVTTLPDPTLIRKSNEITRIGMHLTQPYNLAAGFRPGFPGLNREPKPPLGEHVGRVRPAFSAEIKGPGKENDVYARFLPYASGAAGLKVRLWKGSSEGWGEQDLMLRGDLGVLQYSQDENTEGYGTLVQPDLAWVLGPRKPLAFFLSWHEVFAWNSLRIKDEYGELETGLMFQRIGGPGAGIRLEWRGIGVSAQSYFMFNNGSPIPVPIPSYSFHAALPLNLD